MKQTISGAWYLAFFVIGILLGLLALQLLDGRDPLQGILPKVTEQTVESAAPKSQQRPARSASVAIPSRQQTAPVPPVPAPEAANTAATSRPVAPAAPTAPAPRHEPISCNHGQAGEVRAKAREVAEITDYGGRLSVKLRGEWSYYSDSVRRSFVRKFADADACLNGQSRPIEFFYQGKRYARSDPDRGLSFE